MRSVLYIMERKFLDIPFSVLISVHYGEKAEYLERALISIWDLQSLEPNEIVLVEDGPITPAMIQVIDRWQDKLAQRLKIVRLKENSGLGVALSQGLSHCHYDWVARMDADDVAHRDRFCKQITFISNHPDVDIIGSWISEFDTEESAIYDFRKLPQWHRDIIKVAKKISPMNHMTVIFRKNMVIKAGNYLSFAGMEDYYLWVRMILHGATFANLTKVLVNVRAGRNMIARRGGFLYSVREIRLHYQFFSMGFINFRELIRNIMIRFTIRNLPPFFRKKVYPLLRKYIEYC